MRMDALATALDDLKRKGIRPKYIYTIPTVQNPTGTILPVERRREMLRLAAAHGVPIFEDDCYSDLIWSGERPPALYAMSERGGVIHIGSFSKSIAPALRVGYIVAPWDVMSRMLALKTDGGSGALEQMVLAEYCTANFTKHVPALRRGLRAKLETLMESLNEHFGEAAKFDDPEGRHLPLGQAPRRGRHGEALPAGPRGGRRDQSGTRVVGEQGPRPQPDAPVLREPLPRGDQPGRRGAGRDLPPRVRRPSAYGGMSDRVISDK